MRQEAPPRIYGLIGYPLKHSLSPAMQSAAFKKLGLGGIYLLFETLPADFEAALRKIRQMNVAGFNVTIPYKESIITHLDRLNPQARKIGAVNTVLNKDGMLTGYNTDSPGFIASLKNDLKFDVRDKNVFVIGAGGAARAIGFGLAQQKAKSIIIYDVVMERAKKLASNLSRDFPQCDISYIDSSLDSRLSTIDLLVNASNCGMKKGDPLPVDLALLTKGICVYDIIYNPSPTRLVKRAFSKGIKAVNGIGMLLYQGALAFEIWTRKKAPVETMRKALLGALYGKPH
jgi:shikimate dehydrogenase